MNTWLKILDENIWIHQLKNSWIEMALHFKCICWIKVLECSGPSIHGEQAPGQKRIRRENREHGAEINVQTSYLLPAVYIIVHDRRGACTDRFLNTLILDSHYKLNQLMRLWHFLSAVNSFFKRAFNPVGLDVWQDAWAYAVRICDMYHNLTSWLNY